MIYTTENQQHWNIFIQQFTYAVNCQLSHSTNETLFSMSLFRHLPRPITVFSSSSLPYHAATTINANFLRQNSLHQVAAMQKTLLSALTKQHTRYKWYFDKEVWTLPTFTIVQQIYFNRPPLTVIAHDKKTLFWFNKLLTRTTTPFTVMGVKTHVITIVESVISNTISTNRVMSVLTRRLSTTKVSSNISTPS